MLQAVCATLKNSPIIVVIARLLKFDSDVERFIFDKVWSIF